MTFAADYGDASGGIVAVLVVAALAGLAVTLLFLRTLANALSNCRLECREMQPAGLWLNLIPVFGYYWGFVTVNRVARSLTKEYAARRLASDGDYGLGLGLTYLIVALIVGVVLMPLIAIVSLAAPQYAEGFLYALRGVAGLGVLVPFLMYWARIDALTKRLERDAEVPVPPQPATDPYPDGPGYPGGADAKGYMRVFLMYSIVFLLTLTVGLVLYLASFLKDTR